jgi:hypothetical protein
MRILDCFKLRLSLARAGTEACPYKTLFELRLATRKLHRFKLQRGSARADAAVRPNAEDLDRVASFVIHPGTKKRRMLCIVVSRFSAVFQRLMLLHYQIELDFASGSGSREGRRTTDRA